MKIFTLTTELAELVKSPRFIVLGFEGLITC